MPPASISRLEMSPARFYAMTALLLNMGAPELDSISRAEDKIYDLLAEIERQVIDLAKANNTLSQEVRLTTRRKRDPFEVEDEGLEELMHTASGHNFIHVAFEVLQATYREIQRIHSLVQDLRPGQLVLTNRKHDPKAIDNFDALQHMMLEFQLNKPVIEQFITSVLTLEACRSSIYDRAVSIGKVLDVYYQKLLDRHSVQGIEVHEDPVLTDVAMSVFENVDAHGEIADGKKPNELSAYSVRKATIIADAVKSGPVRALIDNPKSLTGKAAEYLKRLWNIMEDLSTDFDSTIKSVQKACELRAKYSKDVDLDDFAPVLHTISEDLDPNNIVYKEKAVLLTAEERFNLTFRNKTLRETTRLIKSKTSTSKDLVDYVLSRKQELRDYFRDENSFYVCRIGQGNPFTGEAPGMLTVIPGIRPNINLAEILGSGFAEVKDFVNTIEASSKFTDLFMATSPSKTTDKSNVLLVGPQGCGKTEVLRAVGGDKKSIGIFAQGSDFLTCWKGEAEKNPKRLFEAGMKIQKEARRHVHFLIDEIDSVLNGDRKYGETNLTLEFQILMDGVVHYPHLSVWGATNSPERIPMPMIRRFSKVIIVGELDQEQRVGLLKQFTNFMPQTVQDDAWAAFATKLDGATGDVIRKIVDHVWRTKMTWFTENHRAEAEKLVDDLNKDEKFQIANFDSKKREVFKQRLSTFMNVSSHDLEHSIDPHLQNVAIHHEIETARATYEKAHGFLSQIKNGEV